MGYRDQQSSSAAIIGQRVYRSALSGRKGFRPDQIGIPEDDEVWDEIFEAIGYAIRETNPSELTT